MELFEFAVNWISINIKQQRHLLLKEIMPVSQSSSFLTKLIDDMEHSKQSIF